MRGNMKAERARRNLSQRELSEILGCNENLVSRWELGATTPSTKYLLKLAELYGVNANYLLAEEEKE